LQLRPALPRPSDGGFSPLVTWSRDGRRLAATTWDHSVNVWDAANLYSHEGKAELRQASRVRLPRWHLENAAQAFSRNKPEAVRFHLDRVAVRGDLEPGWRLLRGDLLGRMGAWEKARLDYIEAMGDLTQQSGHEWRKHLALRVWKGERVEPTRLAAALVGRLTGEVEAESALSIAAACSLFSGAVADPKRLAAVVRGLPLKPDDQWYQYTLALTSLRAGQLAEAIPPANRSLPLAHAGSAIPPMSYAVLALAHHGLGKPAEAARWRRRLGEYLTGMREKLRDQDRSVPADMGWWDWLTILIFEREVEATLGDDPPQRSATLPRRNPLSAGAE